MTHPYARIVSELQRRIAVGELRPGDRVPSTRQITQEWGVAMATATKVLNALRLAGLVYPVPGVGTVVAEPALAGGSSSAGGPGGANPVATGPQAAAAARTGTRETDAVTSHPRTPAAAPKRTSETKPPQAAPGTYTAPAHEPPDKNIPAALDPHPRTTRPATNPDLSRERIVAAGIAIADADGLAAVSMRRVAAELGAATMSLYRHVPGKEELVVLMADVALTEEPLPPDAPPGWHARLRLLAHLQWRACHRHPWLGEAISLSRPQALPRAMHHTEWALRAMEGLPPKMMLYAYLTLMGFVRGSAVGLEAERRAEQDTGMTADEWTDSQEATLRPLLTEDLPALRRLTAHAIDFDLDELFDFGLRRLLDGFTSLFRDHLRDTVGGS